MLRYVSSIFIILFLSTSVRATHIVGGEFSLLWMARGTTYELSLNMYYDDIHAAPGLMDPGITVYIFEKGTNRMVTPNGVPLVLENKDEFVNYKVPECSLGDELRTRILRYTTKIDLAGFDHPQGYYVVWERCCRNEIIDNIRTPDNVGNTFYMEFPPVSRNGRPFRNSSPQFKDIKGEYFCLNKNQVYDFGAKDANGDKLVYSLVTPFKGYSAPDGYNAMPVPRPRNFSDPYYPTVDWVSGYSDNNMIPGNPPLTIDENTGMISVTPNTEGLFVMAVKVEEYRNGELIGVNRRDFQFMVVDCPNNFEPEVKLRDEQNNYLSSSDTIVVPFGEDLCRYIEVTDSSVFWEDEEPINLFTSGDLPASVFSIEPASFSLSQRNPKSVSNLCFTNCKSISLEEDQVFTLEVIASDDACPMPNTDTLIVKVLVEGMKNEAPKIGLFPDRDTYELFVGDSVSFVVYGTDKDADDIINLVLDEENEEGDEKMSFTPASGQDSIAGVFNWKVDCEEYKNGPFRAMFKISDESCSPSKLDSNAVEFIINDYPTEITDIRPSNLITPNNDGANDYYYIPNMPEGNCSYYFVGIEIYNRWGALVFKSDSKDFRWNASDAPEGLYFYQIDLNDDVKKGWLQVVR